MSKPNWPRPYLRHAVFGQCLFQGLDAEVRVHGVGQPPCKNLATVPVHDGHEIQEPAFLWDIRNVCTPDLVWPVDHHLPEQVRPDFMPRVLLAPSHTCKHVLPGNGCWALGRWAPTASGASTAGQGDDHICGPVVPCAAPFADRQGIAQQCPERLSRPIPRRFQKLFVPSRQHPSDAPAGQWMIAMNLRFSALSPFGS